MKAIYAGYATDVAENGGRAFLYNCTRKNPEIEYNVPILGFDDVQVYIEFGSVKPTAFDVKIVNACTNVVSELIAVPVYLVGKDPAGNWYGVFKFSELTGVPLQFYLSFEIDTAEPNSYRFFTEVYQIEVNCPKLSKVEACFPTRADELSYDSNEIYFGLTTDNTNSLGDRTLYYNHNLYVRKAKVFNDVPKVTFVSNVRKNFRTILDRIYEFKCELVPAWYKEYLLAIYLRGFIKIDGIRYQVTDIAFEALDEDDITWKPYAKLQKENKFYFGCDDCEPPASVCCDPVVTSVTVETEPDPDPGPQPFAANVALKCNDYNDHCHKQGQGSLIFNLGSAYPDDVKIQVAYVYTTGGTWSGAGGSILPTGHPDKSTASSLTPATFEFTIPANTISFNTGGIQFPISGFPGVYWDLNCYPLCNPSYGAGYQVKIYLKVVSPAGVTLALTIVNDEIQASKITIQQI